MFCKSFYPKLNEAADIYELAYHLDVYSQSVATMRKIVKVEIVQANKERCPVKLCCCAHRYTIVLKGKERGHGRQSESSYLSLSMNIGITRGQRLRKEPATFL